MVELPLLLIFPAAMAFAGSMDMLTMTIPNRISLVLLGSFALVALVAALPAPVLAMHLAAGLLLLTVGIGMFAMNWLGGGDAKLLAVGALWVGLDQLLNFVLFTGLFGALLTLVMMLYRSYPAGALPLPDWAVRLHRTTTGLPYGLAIAAAGLTVFPETVIFRALAL